MKTGHEFLDFIDRFPHVFEAKNFRNLVTDICGPFGGIKLRGAVFLFFGGTKNAVAVEIAGWGAICNNGCIWINLARVCKFHLIPNTHIDSIVILFYALFRKMSDIAKVTQSPVVSSDVNSKESLMMNSATTIFEQMNQDAKYDAPYERKGEKFEDLSFRIDQLTFFTALSLAAIALYMRTK